MENAKDELSEDVRNKIKGARVKVVYHDEPAKYSKVQFAHIYKGYDFLENLMAVRSFIQRKYGIDYRMLEILLKIMGMKVFTRADYSSFPKQFTYNKFRTIINSGYVNVLADHNAVENRVFTLNTKGKNIVINFYKYLSGEKRIPLDHTNPMTNSKTKINFDRKKVELIKKMNNTPIKEHFKKMM